MSTPSYTMQFKYRTLQNPETALIATLTSYTQRTITAEVAPSKQAKFDRTTGQVRGLDPFDPDFIYLDAYHLNELNSQIHADERQQERKAIGNFTVRYCTKKLGASREGQLLEVTDTEIYIRSTTGRKLKFDRATGIGPKYTLSAFGRKRIELFHAIRQKNELQRIQNVDVQPTHIGCRCEVTTAMEEVEYTDGELAFNELNRHS